MGSSCFSRVGSRHEEVRICSIRFGTAHQDACVAEGPSTRICAPRNRCKDFSSPESWSPSLHRNPSVAMRALCSVAVAAPLPVSPGLRSKHCNQRLLISTLKQPPRWFLTRPPKLSCAGLCNAAFHMRQQQMCPCLRRCICCATTNTSGLMPPSPAYHHRASSWQHSTVPIPKLDILLQVLVMTAAAAKHISIKQTPGGSVAAALSAGLSSQLSNLLAQHPTLLANSFIETRCLCPPDASP